MNVRVGNTWEIGTIEKLLYLEGSGKILVKREKTGEYALFDYGSSHLARYNTFVIDEKI